MRARRGHIWNTHTHYLGEKVIRVTSRYRGDKRAATKEQYIGNVLTWGFRLPSRKQVKMFL